MRFETHNLYRVTAVVWKEDGEAESTESCHLIADSIERVWAVTASLPFVTRNTAYKPGQVFEIVRVEVIIRNCLLLPAFN